MAHIDILDTLGVPPGPPLPDPPIPLEMDAPSVLSLEFGEIRHYYDTCHEVEVTLTARHNLSAGPSAAIPLPPLNRMREILGACGDGRMLEPSGFDVGGVLGDGTGVSFQEAAMLARTTGVQFTAERCIKNRAHRSRWVVAHFPEPVDGIVIQTINHLRENPYYEGEAGTDAWFYRLPNIDGRIWISEAVVDLARAQLNTVWPEELNQIGLTDLEEIDSDE